MVSVNNGRDNGQTGRVDKAIRIFERNAGVSSLDLIGCVDKCF